MVVLLFQITPNERTVNLKIMFWVTERSIDLNVFIFTGRNELRIAHSYSNSQGVGLIG